MRFRLLVGQHLQDGPTGPNHVYRVGDIIETDNDLCKHNGRGMSPKFERIHESVQEAARAGFYQSERVEYGHSMPPPPTTQERPSVESEKQGGLHGDQQIIRPSPDTSTTPQTAPQKSPQPVRSPEKPAPPSTLQEMDDEDFVKHLQRMSINDLQKYADEEEVDLKGATKKEDIIKVLKANH